MSARAPVALTTGAHSFMPTPLLAFCGLVAIVLLGALVHGLVWVGSANVQVAAAIGDSFGAVNSVFSGLALLGVVITLALQRRDARLSKSIAVVELLSALIARREIALQSLQREVHSDREPLPSIELIQHIDQWRETVDRDDRLNDSEYNRLKEAGFDIFDDPLGEGCDARHTRLKKESVLKREAIIKIQSRLEEIRSLQKSLGQEYGLISKGRSHDLNRFL